MDNTSEKDQTTNKEPNIIKNAVYKKKFERYL